MEFETKQFFTETEDSDIQGFVVVATSTDGGPITGESGTAYRIAEKWNRPEQDGGPVWTTYWIPEETLLARVERGECAPTKVVTDTQFKGVCNLAGIADQVANKAPATA